MTKTKTPRADAQPPSMTLQEVAELERCSVKTVRRAIKAGLLQAYHSGPGGRLLRVTRAAYEAYLKAQRL